MSAPMTPDDFRRCAARAMEQRLDRSRPMWTIDVVDHLHDGTAALIWKIHHSLADGAAALRFAEQVLWDEQADDGAGDAQGAPPASRRRALDAARDAFSLRRPRRLPPTLRRELVKTQHRSPFDGTIGASRVVAFAALPLGPLKRAARTAVPAATINDVVLALVTGGLRCWALARGGSLSTVRVKVPVHLQNVGSGVEAANRDSLFLLAAPLAEPDPVERLRGITTQTTVCKRGADAIVLDTLLRDLGHVAPPLRRMLDRLIADPRAFALAVSNLAGPRRRPSLLGAPVRSLYSVAEIGERHGLRVAVVSMADELSFGLCADPAIVGDLEPLVSGLRSEAASLLAVCGATA